MRHRVFLCVVFGAMTLMYGYLLGRLIQIQVLDQETYAELAREYHLFERRFEAPRGRIYDRRGEILAESIPVKSLWARPRQIRDHREVAEALAPVLGRSVQSIEQTLDLPYSAVCLAPAIETNEAIEEVRQALATIAGEGDPGLDLTSAFERCYPHRNELAHVLGCVGVDGDGKFGIERAFEDHLTGDAGRETLERDGRMGVFYSGRGRRESPEPGGDVVLTIDMVIQHFLERQVQWAFEKWEAESAIGIVVSPSDGKILALANRPTFDANRLREARTSDLVNRALTDPFAPGSTFKPIVFGAALDAGVLQATDTFDCGGGEWRFDRRLLHDVHPSGELDVEGVLVKSSNIGAAKIGLRLGGRRLREAIQAFGFGKKTGIVLGGESSGRMTQPRNWTDTYTTVSVSFGQEILVTPMQLAMGFSALVNGGRYHAPRIVDHWIDRDGNVETPFTPVMRRVISSEASAEIREMLVAVCEEGSGKPARVPGYRVGGKTGTTEKFKGKRKSGYVSSFVAFAPAQNPRLCVLVMVNEPKGAHYGRIVAAPAVGRVLADSLAYLEVPPDPDLGDSFRSASIDTADPDAPTARDYEVAN